jgi:hypothetical protein
VARTFVAGLLAISLFFAGSVIFVLFVTAPVTTSETPAPAAEPGEATGSHAPAVEPHAPTAEPVTRAGKGVSSQLRRTRFSFRRELIAGFAKLEERAAECAHVNAADGRGALADTAFTLALETTAGGIRVVDVALESRGSANDADVACVRATLRGQVVPAPSAEPGKKLMLPFSLSRGP